MRKNIFRATLILMVAASAISSCIRDKFQYNGYDDQLKGYAPVDSIENGHDWSLTSTGTVGVGNIPTDAYKIVLLNGNPFTETGVEVMAEVMKSTLVSRYANISYVAPSTMKKIYAAALDADGNYLSIGSASPNSTVNLGSTAPTGTPNPTRLQRFYYGFEAEYPNPGDWDYNDVVMSVTKEVVEDNPQVVALHVRLDAVGYLTQIAAAIRLVGYNYNKVTITQDESTTFVRAPERERIFIKSPDVQLYALNGDAVINLFDDAHLGMFHLSEDGSVYRRYFNTKESNTSGEAASSSPTTVTYYIDFGDVFQAREFTLAELDPFIIVQYGTAGENYWEVHTYPYKLTETFYHYYNGAAASYNNGFSWAVTIPYADFLWPYEETPIGELKNTIVTGAYQKSGHSFGEWMLDHTKATDWYCYPAEGAVFVPEK